MEGIEEVPTVGTRIFKNYTLYIWHSGKVMHFSIKEGVGGNSWNYFPTASTT